MTVAHLPLPRVYEIVVNLLARRCGTLQEWLFLSQAAARKLALLQARVRPNVMLYDMLRAAPYAQGLSSPLESCRQIVFLDDLLSDRYAAPWYDGGNILGTFSSTFPKPMAAVARLLPRLLCGVECRLIARRGSKQAGIAETLRALRLSLQAMEPAGACKVVLVTSSEAGEGKSTIALSLAERCGVDGLSVLLMEADLRRPALTNMVKVWPRSNLETQPGGLRLEDEVHIDDSSGVHCLLTAGISRRAQVQLESQDFKDSLAAARLRFQLIIISSQPVLRVADALVLAKLSDVVLFVVRSERMALGSHSRIYPSPRRCRRPADPDGAEPGRPFGYCDDRGLWRLRHGGRRPDAVWIRRRADARAQDRPRSFFRARITVHVDPQRIDARHSDTDIIKAGI